MRHWLRKKTKEVRHWFRKKTKDEREEDLLAATVAYDILCRARYMNCGELDKDTIKFRNYPLVTLEQASGSFVFVSVSYGNNLGRDINLNLSRSISANKRILKEFVRSLPTVGNINGVPAFCSDGKSQHLKPTGFSEAEFKPSDIPNLIYSMDASTCSHPLDKLGCSVEGYPFPKEKKEKSNV